MLFFERLLKYELHRVTSKISEPRRGLRKVCSWPDVVYLRNKFHFPEVHGSMNATDHVQSKWRPKGFTLTLHGTRCVLTSMNLRKMKFISYIYILFLHRFCSLFVESLFKSCK